PARVLQGSRNRRADRPSFSNEPFRLVDQAPEKALYRGMKFDADIVIAGTGPAGLLAALALAQAGLSAILVGPPVNTGDRRTTALMKPSLDFLDGLGVLDAVKEGSAPLRVMRIADATSRLLRSPVVSFRAAEIGEEYFGLNIPNRNMLPALDAAVKANDGIRIETSIVAHWQPLEDGIQAELENGKIITASLAIAPDARLSPAREPAGSSVRTATSCQSALDSGGAHTRPHGGTSTEFHTERGPFTVVPLPGMRSSLEWVSRPHRAE